MDEERKQRNFETGEEEELDNMDNGSEDSEDSSNGHSGGNKLYNINIKPSQIVKFELKFTPREQKNYFFELPL